MTEATPAITFTLAEIRKHNPCERGWELLCKNLGGIENYGEHTPITALQIYESNGTEDLFWCLKATPEETQYLWRHLACDCALLNEHLFTDESILNCIEVARRYADGLASDEELDAAQDAAREAAWVAAQDAARNAARNAVWAAQDAAQNAAQSAAWGDAWNAAQDAVWAAQDDAQNAAQDAARNAVWAAQFQLLELYCQHGERPEGSAELLKQFYQEELKNHA